MSKQLCTICRKPIRNRKFHGKCGRQWWRLMSGVFDQWPVEMLTFHAFRTDGHGRLIPRRKEDLHV